MSEFLKPQSPLQHKDGAFIYPLTTADQVILEDNNRLNFALEHLVYVDEEHQESAVASLDADTLGGHPVEDFLRPKAGFIYPLAGSVIPEGFLLCDGAEYGRTEFPELFAAIGTIYGEGDGSTTFNVPNLQTRVPVGAGGEFVLGATGGEAEHTLTVAEMPSHNHSSEDNNTTGNIGFQESSDHGYVGFSMPWTYISERTDLGIHVASNGGSQPHNNMQPYTVVNYIIATGKDTGVSVSDIVMGAQALPLEVQYGGTGATNAEEARQNLGITPENIGAISMELLWKNASPFSEFPAQTVYVDLSGGTHVMIGYKPVAGGLIVEYCIAKVGEDSRLESCCPADNYYKYSIKSREFKVKQDSIVFEEGKEVTHVTNPAENSLHCSVVEIYIIKGVFA